MHKYWGIDYEAVWSIVQTKIPDLIDALISIP
ncbi:MAG: HepT-like ribonuclease domain-containing protein [Candidatus Woesearchaeota archaeon]